MPRTNDLARLASAVAARMSGPLHTENTRVVDDPGLPGLLDALELFIPQVLREDFSEWKTESIDRFLIAGAERDTEESLCLFGLAIIISDQTVTPCQIHLRRSADKSSLEHAEVLLGEPGAGVLGISGPPCTESASVRRLLDGLSPRLRTVNWIYRGTFAPRE